MFKKILVAIACVSLMAFALVACRVLVAITSTSQVGIVLVRRIIILTRRPFRQAIPAISAAPVRSSAITTIIRIY